MLPAAGLCLCPATPAPPPLTAIAPPCPPQVKSYLERQWGKILAGRVSVQDFIFAKEVRLGTYSARAAVLPPQALVATRAMAADPR